MIWVWPLASSSPEHNTLIILTITTGIFPYCNPNKNSKWKMEKFRLNKAMVCLLHEAQSGQQLDLARLHRKREKKALVVGEQSRQCFLPSVEQTKAAFYFPRDASWIYSLRKELLNLKGNPIPFCLNAPNQRVAVCPCECGPVETDASIRWNLDRHASTCWEYCTTPIPEKSQDA